MGARSRLQTCLLCSIMSRRLNAGRQNRSSACYNNGQCVSHSCASISLTLNSAFVCVCVCVIIDKVSSTVDNGFDPFKLQCDPLGLLATKLTSYVPSRTCEMLKCDKCWFQQAPRAWQWRQHGGDQWHLGCQQRQHAEKSIWKKS